MAGPRYNVKTVSLKIFVYYFDVSKLKTEFLKFFLEKLPHVW